MKIKPIPFLSDKKHIIVKIYAAGVNPVDAKKVLGDKLPSFFSVFEYLVDSSVKSCIPGFDFSGVVYDIPKEDQDNFPFRVGDKVYGTAPPFVGTFCEYQLIPLDRVNHMPLSLSFEEAAALPLIGLTCLQAFSMALSLGNKKSMDHILIIGASGGTGHFAIQYAKKYYDIKRVVGICGPTNLKWVEDTLGADYVIDYKKENWKEFLIREVDEFGPFDFVLDTVVSNQLGDKTMKYENFLRFSSCSKHKILVDGPYIRLGGDSLSWLAAGIKKLAGLNLFQKTSELFWVRLSYSSKELETLKKIIDEKKIKPHISQVFSFTQENIALAFDLLKKRHVKGKIVIQIKNVSLEN